MQALGLVPMVTGATTRLMNSALPDSPVVAPRPPSSVRLRFAWILHRVADRVARSDDPSLRYDGQWA